MQRRARLGGTLHEYAHDLAVVVDALAVRQVFGGEVGAWRSSGLSAARRHRQGINPRRVATARYLS
ncbi:hypothetical protein ACWEQN_41365 [Streptomyces sp. NPDC004129]